MKSFFLLAFLSNDAAKAQMAGRGIDGLGHARCRTVAPAIIRRAQVRPAFHYFARDFDAGHVGIIALVPLSTSRIEVGAARLRNLLVLLIPICSPLPNVAGHLIEPVTVGWKTSHRGSPLESVFFEILPGEFALPGVGHVLAIRCKRIPPNEFRSV